MAAMLDGKFNNPSLRSELKLHYYANYAKISCIVLPSNMAAVSHRCKPRICVIISIAMNNLDIFIKSCYPLLRYPCYVITFFLPFCRCK